MATKFYPEGKLGRKVVRQFSEVKTLTFPRLENRLETFKETIWGFLPPPPLLLQNSFLRPDCILAYPDLTGAKETNQVSKASPAFPVSAPPIQLLRPSTLILTPLFLILHVWSSDDPEGSTFKIYSDTATSHHLQGSHLD